MLAKRFVNKVKEEEEMAECDAAIIRAGQAAPSLAKRWCDEEMKVAISKRKLFGVTCMITEKSSWLQKNLILYNRKII